MKAIKWNKKISNKRIEQYALAQEPIPYWTPFKFGRRFFIMTFQYNIYEVLL